MAHHVTEQRRGPRSRRSCPLDRTRRPGLARASGWSGGPGPRGQDHLRAGDGQRLAALTARRSPPAAPALPARRSRARDPRAQAPQNGAPFRERAPARARPLVIRGNAQPAQPRGERWGSRAATLLGRERLAGRRASRRVA